MAEAVDGEEGKLLLVPINHNFYEDREPKRIETFVLQTLNTRATEANS